MGRRWMGGAFVLVTLVLGSAREARAEDGRELFRRLDAEAKEAVRHSEPGMVVKVVDPNKVEVDLPRVLVWRRGDDPRKIVSRALEDLWRVERAMAEGKIANQLGLHGEMRDAVRKGRRALQAFTNWIAEERQPNAATLELARVVSAQVRGVLWEAVWNWAEPLTVRLVAPVDVPVAVGIPPYAWLARRTRRAQHIIFEVRHDDEAEYLFKEAGLPALGNPDDVLAPLARALVRIHGLQALARRHPDLAPFLGPRILSATAQVQRGLAEQHPRRHGVVVSTQRSRLREVNVRYLALRALWDWAAAKDASLWPLASDTPPQRFRAGTSGGLELQTTVTVIVGPLQPVLVPGNPPTLAWTHAAAYNEIVQAQVAPASVFGTVKRLWFLPLYTWRKHEDLRPPSPAPPPPSLALQRWYDEDPPERWIDLLTGGGGALPRDMPRLLGYLIIVGEKGGAGPEFIDIGEGGSNPQFTVLRDEFDE